MISISEAQINLEATYDGEKLEIVEVQGPAYPGFYKEEIKRITMLGDGKDLDWKLTRRGLIIDTPNEKPCDYAFVFKIERHHRPKFD